MRGKLFVVVVYDISNDKRRTKLHNKLKGYGSPVQYSVFECILTAAEYNKMKKEIKRILRPRLDHVRYYSLCADCKEKIEIIGRHEITKEPDVIVI